MKKLILTVVMVLAFVATAMAADCWVDGYYKKNGTYVQGYWRSCPDEPFDKWNNPKQKYDDNNYYEYKDCWVDGYYKENGTYVQGYWRSCR